MAKLIKTIAPVDSLSGMFGKRSHSMSGKAIIANIRKQGGAWIDGAPYMYFSVLTKSTYPTNPTKKMIDNQTRFATVSQNTFARLANPTQMQADQLAYRAQTKYKTLKQYVWNMEAQAYDQAHP